MNRNTYIEHKNNVLLKYLFNINKLIVFKSMFIKTFLLVLMNITILSKFVFNFFVYLKKLIGHVQQQFNKLFVCN